MPNILSHSLVTHALLEPLDALQGFHALLIGVGSLLSELADLQLYVQLVLVHLRLQLAHFVAQLLLHGAGHIRGHVSAILPVAAVFAPGLFLVAIPPPVALV